MTIIDEIRKGLLKNLPKPSTLDIEICNSLVEKRVDSFIEDVIGPSIDDGSFRKELVTKWYEIYCEGTSALKTNFDSLNILGTSESQITVLVNFLSGKEITELANLGGNYMADCYSFIISWFRDSTIKERKESVYSVSTPLEWILKVDPTTNPLPDNVKALLYKIKLIGSLRL